jgi:hypothetical protein
MANQVMDTAGNLTVIVPQIWSANWYQSLLAELPFNSIVSKDWEGEIKNLGDTVKISQFPEFSDATELAESAANDADAITVTQQSLVINKRLVKDFIVTDKASLQSLPAMDQLQNLAIYAILKKVQSIIIDDTLPSTSAPDQTIGYTSGVVLDLAKMVSAKKLLDAQDVPQENRHCVLGTNQMNDLLSIANFSSSDYVSGANVVSSGAISNPLIGFMPHMTTEVGDVCYFFHRSYFTMAAQKDISVKVFDLGVQGIRAARVNVDILAGFKLLDNKRVVSIS